MLWGLYHGLWLCLETVTLPRADALQARIAARRPLAGKLFAAARCLLSGQGFYAQFGVTGTMRLAVYACAALYLLVCLVHALRREAACEAADQTA